MYAVAPIHYLNHILFSWLASCVSWSVGFAGMAVEDGDPGIGLLDISFRMKALLDKPAVPPNSRLRDYIRGPLQLPDPSTAWTNKALCAQKVPSPPTITN